VLGRVLPPSLTFLGALLVWEVVVRVGEVAPYLVPAPSRVATAAWEEAGPLAWGFLLTSAGALAGWLMSAVVGVLVAVALASSRTLERSVYPFTVFLQTVPLVTIAPLLVIWFGYGLQPVIANGLTGLRSVDPNLRDLFALYGASRWERLVKLELPSALPSLFTGLRISAGLAVIGAIVGEFFTSYAGEDAGLGVLVTSWLKQFRTDRVFAAVALASLLGLLLFAAVNLAGWACLRRWHASEQDR
jgi:NitT/TauT family transport system permease protein